MVRSRYIRAILAITTVCVLLVLAGCQGSAGSGKASGEAGVAPTGAAFNPPAEVLMPAISEDAGNIDTSHLSNGYVVARTSSAARLKFQVNCGDKTYNYDLPNDGSPAVFPLNMGDGDYEFRIMKNAGGNDYLEAERAEGSVTLVSEFAPFVIPNQYCNYNEQSACVAKARELTNGVANQGEAVQRVCEYVVEHVTYDTAKARELSNATGYIPNPDETLASGSGVCFDYASLGAAMLRSLGFPTKIITGYVSPGDLYHAWVMVYVDGSWKTGEFSVSADSWSRVDLTFAASGATEFTGDGTSYTERYVY